jgi:hypothetical protein
MKPCSNSEDRKKLIEEILEEHPNYPLKYIETAINACCKKWENDEDKVPDCVRESLERSIINKIF